MRILIADDHEVIRSSVIRVLQSRADVEECAEATNGKEAVERALQWKPDLVLLDIRLPVLSGFDAAREIKQHQPDIPILLFSIHDTQEILEEAKLVGDGFILKDKIVEMLPNAIDALRHKQPFFPSDSRTDSEDTVSAKCPKCGQPFPFSIELDVIDALRCPNCDALFEYGKFVCYGPKPST
ncbi:MAG TPA: response regulator transcription factor [Candidatus Acidoferrum sp.]